jgi:hypothetical protein
MPELLAISLWQPWAHLIAIGAKRFETRSWSTTYRGLMAIHAGKKWTSRMAAQCLEEPFLSILSKDEPTFRLRAEANAADLSFAFGAVIAIADLVEVWPTSELAWASCPKSLRNPAVPPDLAIGLQERAFGDFSHGRYAWQYENVTRLPEPIPCPGKQGLWVPDAEIVDRLMEVV